ncbi:MAG: hypothetical protein IJU70_13600 [Lentisphaeria bacterium]|nr:hypothetical protein [Lentisphaeria bacterium]
MHGMEVSLSSFWLVAIMICVILLILVAQISHFYAKFQEARKDYEANMIGLAGQLKKLQTTLSEQLGEQRRLLRQQGELLELKRAEMTGDFEIVEEPVPAAAPRPPQAAAAPEEAQTPPAPPHQPGKKFPDINLG